MKLKPQNLLSLLKPHFTTTPTLFHHQQWRSITKVRLKWVKNKFMDHIIDKQTDIKAAMLLKDAIKRSPTNFITAKTITNWQKPLGLTFPVLRFLRRYPTLFHEFPHTRYPNLSCFRLTDLALALDEEENRVYQEDEKGIVERICKLFIMTRSKNLPISSLYQLKWDMGLCDNFEKMVTSKYPDMFKVVEKGDGFRSLCITGIQHEYGVSVLEKRREENSDDYQGFKKGLTALNFPMNFPKGYGYQKKVKAWMEEFQKLPYVSPYEDVSRIDPCSELMEKRNVGVLHEILGLMIHKMTKRNYLRSLREELSLPHRFTRIFTRYPGIFYLSLKCKTTTVVLKEGYKKGKLVDPHPLVRVRDKFYHVMRTGLLYRGKGLKVLKAEDCLIDDGEVGDGEGEDNVEEEWDESEEECWEGVDSDLDDEADD